MTHVPIKRRQIILQKISAFAEIYNKGFLPFLQKLIIRKEHMKLIHTHQNY